MELHDRVIIVKALKHLRHHTITIQNNSPLINRIELEIDRWITDWGNTVFCVFCENLVLKNQAQRYEPGEYVCKDCLGGI